jgi:AraC-like DNA-binding protein
MTQPPGPNAEWSQYYSIGAVNCVEALHARFVTHHYPRHAHEYYVIGLIEAGAQAYWYRGARHITPAGQVFLVNPDEMHTGESASAGGYTYCTVYPRVECLTQLIEDLSGRGAVAYFRDAVIDDVLLARMLRACHKAIANDFAMEGEALLIQALARLVTVHAEPGIVAKRIGRERPGVRRARDYLEAHFSRAVSLAELARVAALSPYHLARAFQREVGVPPHLYLEGVRIRRARGLLESGVPLASAALLVGYSDQSHLTRRFKRIMGVTPGVYVRKRKIRQDGER